MVFDKGDKILFIGDSISDYERARPVGEGLFGAWGTSYVACVGSLLTCAYPSMGLRVVNMGVSGNQARDLEARWKSDVEDLSPDWVSVLIGINDVWRRFDSPLLTEQHVSLEDYAACCERLARRTEGRVKGMVWMSPYIMEPNRSDPMRACMDGYGQAVRELAARHGFIFVDLQAAWDALFEHMHPMNIAWDRIHPNQIGSMYIARRFLDAVGFEWDGGAR